MGRVRQSPQGEDDSLTTTGHRRLREEVNYWGRLSDAINLALAAVPGDL